MSDHCIVWEFDSDYVRPRIECSAPEGADCRLGAADYNVCHCEQWNILRDDDSGPYHFADGSDRAIGDRHYMTDSGECQVTLFLGEDPTLIPELCNDRRASFEIGRTAIEPVWTGDGYDWKRVAS